MHASKFSMRGVLDTINKSKTHNCERNLSLMILKSNQMIYFVKLGNNFICVLSNSNNLPGLKAREINRILTKRS